MLLTCTLTARPKLFFFAGRADTRGDGARAATTLRGVGAQAHQCGVLQVCGMLVRGDTHVWGHTTTTEARAGTRAGVGFGKPPPQADPRQHQDGFLKCLQGAVSPSSRRLWGGDAFT